MDLDKLNFLPHWEEVHFHKAIRDPEAWKTNDKNEASRALYNQWREVFGLVVAFAETLNNGKEGEEDMTRRLIYENVMIVAPKILSAVDTLYMLQMENAAIIRTNCRQLMEQISFAALSGIADDLHREVIETEMDAFRSLFKQWVTTFRQDEYEDEWGLF
ncbi:hypothetical protein [Flavisolibacter tropicus]|uniref:Uncharacterized protein n=1 Tax=Flavisolibacter tropicus TaxID=1492898 RepID=A0A172TWT8_9BACT|nr:hypothetical protein [Flavisolibacter tropicus]ANE51555.1 hypothetical protein SY85_14620 [Flavisolibacter tropicus]